MTTADADAVLRIYGDGIATGHATFETETPSWTAFDTGKLAGRVWWPRAMAGYRAGRR